MDADGSNVTRLTDHPAIDECPTWSPDGIRTVRAGQRLPRPSEHFAGDSQKLIGPGSRDIGAIGTGVAGWATTCPTRAFPQSVGIDICVFDPDLDPDGRRAETLADVVHQTLRSAAAGE